MANIALGVKFESTAEETEAANALLLLWERAAARNKHLHGHVTPSGTHVLLFRNPSSQQRPGHCFPVLTAQPCMLASSVYRHYVRVGSKASCSVGRVQTGGTFRAAPARRVSDTELDSRGHAGKSERMFRRGGNPAGKHDTSDFTLWVACQAEPMWNLPESRSYTQVRWLLSIFSGVNRER